MIIYSVGEPSIEGLGLVVYPPITGNLISAYSIFKDERPPYVIPGLIEWLLKSVMVCLNEGFSSGII